MSRNLPPRHQKRVVEHNFSANFIVRLYTAGLYSDCEECRTRTLTDQTSDVGDKIDYRWLLAARIVFVPAGVLCLVAIDNWAGAALWVAISTAYLTLRPLLFGLIRKIGRDCCVPYISGLLGTSILCIGPVIASISASPLGPIVGLVMLAAGVQFLIAAYAAVPRLGLLVAIPCALTATWVISTIDGATRSPLLTAGLGMIAALLFAAVHARTVLFDRQQNARNHASLIDQITHARDAAVQAEQRRADALERLQLSLDMAPAGLAFFGPDDRLCTWNDLYAEIACSNGVDLAKGMLFQDILVQIRPTYVAARDKHGRRQWTEDRLTARASGASIEQARQDGRWYQFDDRRMPDGGTASVIVDVSELKTKETFNRAIFDNNAAPMWIVDPVTLDFLQVNEEALSLFGWSREEFATMSVLDVLSECEHDLFRHELSSAEEKHYRPTRPWKFRSRSGGELFIRPFASSLRGIDGKTVLVAPPPDVTAKVLADRKLATNTRALKAAKKRAETASRAKSEFLAMMSHELRTPLNGVLGMSQALQGAGLPPEQETQVDTIVRSGQALTAILNDILDLSKIESGRMDLDVKTLNIRTLVQNSCELWFQVAEDKGLKFEIDLEADVPEWFAAGGLRVRQIILNLVSNAIKFTSEGQVSLRLARADAGVVLTVEDSGCGISASAQKRLFQPFEQLDAGTARSHGGTGLGLAITRKLCEMMNGEVTVSSRPGQGTVMTVTLPLKPTSPPEAIAPQDENTLPADLTILVAEDNTTNQAVIRALLGSLGCHVTVVDNGFDALEAHRSSQFDLVLMDVHMPIMDGIAAVRAIRRGEAGDHTIPIIALTADAMISEREQFLANGFDYYVAKPIEAGKLFQTIAEAARRDTVSDRRRSA